MRCAVFEDCYFTNDGLMMFRVAIVILDAGCYSIFTGWSHPCQGGRRLACPVEVRSTKPHTCRRLLYSLIRLLYRNAALKVSQATSGLMLSDKREDNFVKVVDVFKNLKAVESTLLARCNP